MLGLWSANAQDTGILEILHITVPTNLVSFNLAQYNLDETYTLILDIDALGVGGAAFFIQAHFNGDNVNANYNTQQMVSFGGGNPTQSASNNAYIGYLAPGERGFVDTDFEINNNRLQIESRSDLILPGNLPVIYLLSAYYIPAVTNYVSLDITSLGTQFDVGTRFILRRELE